MQAGYLGVGNMGLPMAGKILDAGHELVVYDISDAAMQPLLERQARRAASPKDLGDLCETVFVSLPTLDALRCVGQQLEQQCFKPLFCEFELPEVAVCDPNAAPLRRPRKSALLLSLGLDNMASGTLSNSPTG